VKRFAYNALFQYSDFIMQLRLGDQDHFTRWWNVSEYFRSKRDAA
jgi:hypothetical protein